MTAFVIVVAEPVKPRQILFFLYSHIPSILFLFPYSVNLNFVWVLNSSKQIIYVKNKEG